jgi:hypothetical protein
VTRPKGFSEPAPLVSTVQAVRTSAGVPVTVPLTITNRAAEPRVFVVSAAGVDPSWLPFPSQSVPVAAGESIQAAMMLRPADGTLPARYPLAVAVQALDPGTGHVHAASTIQAVDLVVDAPGQISITLDPADATAVYSRKFFVVLQNSSESAETVHLDARSPYSTAVDVSRKPVVVPPGGTVRVPGRLTVSRPTLFRRKIRHAYSVTARTSGAPRFVEGSLTARSVVGPTGAKVIGALLVIALWVSLALIFVPKLADKVRKPSNQAGNTQTLTVKPPNGKKGGGKKGSGGSGGSGGGNSPSGGGSGTGSGGGAGGAAGSNKASAIALNGTITGSAPAGVLVSLSPSRFGNTTPNAGSGAAAQTVADTPIGKLTPQALAPDTLSSHRAPSSDRSTVTTKDGAWSFPDVKAVGYYVLQFSKPGYQTQRFIIDPTSATATAPMKVELVPGTGALHGVVRNASGGNVGAATITITDGTNTLTTSTISKGTGIGTWSINGLSTPSSYLVSASKAGLGVASRLVSLAASGKGAADLTMFSDMATLSGYVHAFTDGHDAGVGGVQISATNGTLTRSATTVTSGSQTGRFTLPNLPLGKWVVNIAAAGYQLQSRTVNVVAGKRLPQLRAGLSPSTATVSGVVKGLTGTPALRALSGAGLTLSNSTNAYKQTSLRGGRFSFADVAPGTYTLSAEYFGYTTSFQTVVAQAGIPGKQAMFHLAREVTTNASVISGYVGNAASSSGSLGCEVSPVTTKEFPDGIPTFGCFVYFALTDGDGNPVPTTLGSADNANRPKGSVSPDGPTSYILSRNPADGDGLAPGQYRLTISAAGYLPATISIDVPFNGAATAPQVDLFPANSIAGRVNAIGQINGDGLTTNVEGKNCVVAVPINLPASVFDQGNFSCDGSAIPADGFGPADITRLQKKCTALGHAEPGWGVISNSGKYTVDNLCDGQYVMYLVITNPAYDADSAATPKVSVAHGQTLEYSPSLPRRPVIDIQVNTLNANTGVTQAAAPNTPVTADCDTAATVEHPVNTTVLQVTTDNDGIVTLWGVPAGDVDCTLTVNGVTADTGIITTVDNQSYSGVATVVSSLSPVFGQITSKFGSSAENPVVGATVYVTGVVSYTGAHANTDTQPVVTNADGCYVITATTITLTDSDIPTGCGTAADFSTANMLTMPLRSKHVTVGVDQSNVGQSLGSSATILVDKVDSLALAVPAVRVAALPVSTAGLKIVTQPIGLPLNNATVTVHDYSSTAQGAGTVTASINSAGDLIWADANVSSGNMAWQGIYTLDIDVPGFSSPLSATLKCGYFDDDTTDDTTVPDPTPTNLHCTLAPATINALAELRGQVNAPSLTPPHTTSGPLPGATLIARRCAATCPSVDVASSTACNTQIGDYTASTTFDGKYDFVAAGGVRYMTVGRYELIVCASGMITKVVQPVTLSGGYVSTEDQNVTMSLLGGVSGTVSASNNSLGLQGVDVHLYSCPTGDCAAQKTSVDELTTGSGGTYQFSGATGRYFLPPGQYRVTYDATALGYTFQQQDFTIDTADAPASATSVTLVALGGLGGRVTQAGTSPLQPVTNATLTLMRCDTPADVTSCTHLVTTTTPDGGGNYQFSGTSGRYFLSDGYYQLQVDATGFSSYDWPAPLHLVSGDNLVGDVSLTQQGALSGTITDNLSNNIGSATVTMTKCSDATCTSLLSTPAPQSTVTDSSGAYAFGTVANPYVLEAGTWQFEVTAAGHVQPFRQILLIHGGTQQPTGVQQELTALDALGGQVTVSGEPGTLVSGATVTVRAHCADPASCANPTLATTTSNPDGTYQFTRAGQRYFLSDGDYDVTVSAAGFATTTVTTTAASGDNTSDIELPRLAALQGTVTDNTTGNPVVSGATVLVKRCVDSASPCTPTTVAAQIMSATTDASGQFSFIQFGTPYLFAPGLWQITITAAGHTPSAATDVTLGNGLNTLAYPDIPHLAAYGSITGTVFGNGASLQQLSGATVSATCQSTTDPSTTCPTTPLTATTSGTGVYNFTGTGTPWALVPGSWTFSASAPGYVTNSVTQTVVSGINPATSGSTAFDITDEVRTATQPIRVKIADTPTVRYTSHAVVTLVRNDAPATTILTDNTDTPSIFVASDLKPGVYTVTIVGDTSQLGQSIQLTYATLNVPLVATDATTLTTFVVPASMYRTSLTGKVVGTNGKASTTNLGNIPVELYDAGTTSRAGDLGDDPIFTKTASDGTFSIAGIPNGLYDIHINDVDRDTPPVPSGLVSPNANYGAQTVSSVSIAYGATVAVPTVTLAPTTQTVKVEVDYDSAEDLSGGTATLTPSDGATWDPLTVTTPDSTTSTTSRTFTFTNVPRGCWSFSLPFPVGSVHPGGVSTTAGTSSCRVSVPASQTAQTPTPVVYHFDEYVLTVTASISLLALDTPAPTINLVLTKSGSSSIVGSVTNGSTTTIHALPGQYTVSLAVASATARSTRLFPTGAFTNDDVDLSSQSQSASVSVTERALGTVNIDAYVNSTAPHKTGADSTITYSLSCPSPDSTCPAGIPTALIPTDQQDTGSGATFSNVPPGQWVLTASSGGGVVENSRDTYKFTVSAGGTVTVTNSNWTNH